MEIIATAKYLRIGPKKIRTLASLIKKLKIDDALNVLEYSPKSGAGFLKEVILSALANAKNNYKIEKDNLFIKKIDIFGGPAIKRQRAVSKGMGHPYKRRTSHIKVVLETVKIIETKKLTDKKQPKKEKNNGS